MITMVETYKVKRWSCCVSSHAHVSREKAASCSKRYGVNKKPQAIFIEKMRWTCADKDHCHSTQKVAARCLEKSALTAHLPSPDDSKRRRWAITTARCAENKTLKKVGEEFGRSPERIRQIEARCFDEMRESLTRLSKDISAIIKVGVAVESITFYGVRVL